MQKINSRIENLGLLPCRDIEFGDVKLNVFPIEHNPVSLPKPFEIWESLVNSMLEFVPIQDDANTHYVTIDSKFFTLPESLRREGIHLDGNFCCDPKFSYASWGGGGGGTWAGLKYNHKTGKPEADWVSPYMKVEDTPIGDYISDTKGGILCVSSHVGCAAWSGYFEGDVKDGGDFSELEYQLKDENHVVFDEHQLYFMSSNTPHESLLIEQGVRRTFVRLTLNHNYDNTAIRSKQREEVLSECL